jgi:hypothetical protein
VEWFHNEGGSRRLYTALFKRPHTDVHGYSPLGVDGIFTAQSSASDLLSPWTNYNRMAELYKWRAWREGAALVGLISGSGVPQRIELGGIPQRVIRPALMDSTGRLDIFFLNAVGDLGFARFPAPKSGAAAPGKVLWRAQLATGEFITARAALAPQQAGGGRYLANASQVANAVAVSLMRLGDAQQAQPWQSGRVPNAYGLPQCEPALRVAQDGAVHFSLLVALDKSRKQIALADVTFGPGDKPPVSRVMPLGQMPGIPQAGAVSFTVAPGVPVQREWFLLFDANEYRRSGDEGDPKTLGVNPIVPVEMIVQAAGTYILGLGDQGQPKFQVLE